MILKRVHVRNFRSIRDAAVELGKQTAILGTNGAGKSTVLRAIDRFYGSQSTVEPDDFFGRDLTKQIEIILTFCDFNDAELDMFGSRIHNDEMVVARVFEANNSRNNGKYFGMTIQCLEFAPIRTASTATSKRSVYDLFRSNNSRFARLPNARSADQLEEILLKWENENPSECKLGRDDGQFFGFTNVARGALNKSTSFVFIPAVRDVSADSVDARGAVISKLMELVVRSAIQKRSEIKIFEIEISKRFRELTSADNLPELGFLSDDLTRTLQLFYADAGVGLKWRPTEDFSLPLPVSDVFLREDGFEGPVDKKGHGLQRAFIFTLLQHLAQATSVENNKNESSRSEETGKSIADDSVDVQSQMPGLILAIEEPELYQHPTKQRHFANVLTKLSDGSLPGIAAQTQIMFASHSSIFVSPHRFEEIRLARRKTTDHSSCKECVIVSSTISKIAARFDEVDLVEIGTTSVSGLRARLHVMDTEIAEGFFADGVVLVEGESDRAAIKAVASLANIDLESLGIAVLQVRGKNNLDKISLIFQDLLIPIYIIWDCDKGAKPEDRGEKTNRRLQRIFGKNETEISDFISVVTKKYACFEDKLETCIKSEIGIELYGSLLNEARIKFGMKDRNSVEKSPSAMKYVMECSKLQGKSCLTLEKILHAIKQMRYDTYTSEAGDGIMIN